MNSCLFETEVKIEVKDESQIRDLLCAVGFKPTALKYLKDYYIFRTKSPLGGWDFERLRSINESKYLRTVKRWEADQQGNRVRIEDEDYIDEERFKEILAKGFELSYSKEREDYKGVIKGRQATISIDTLNLDSNKRVFLECEVMTNRNESHKVRLELKQWMADNLNVNTSIEAKSMLDIVLESSIATK